MKTLIFLSFLKILVLSAVAQVTFEKTYGFLHNDVAFSIRECTDNNYIICGYTYSLKTGMSEIYILKLDQFGDTLWTRRIGEHGQHLEGLSVSITHDQGYIITGSWFNNGVEAPYLLKLSKDGEQEWVVSYHDELYNGYGTAVIQSSDSGYVFQGYRYSTNKESKGSGPRIFIAKADSAGNLVWEKSYGHLSRYPGKDILETTDGGYVFCGDWKIPLHSNAWLFKSNHAGNLLWSRNYGDSNSSELAKSFKQTSDGSFIVCGTRNPGWINPQVYLVKTDANGYYLWSRILDGQASGSAIDLTDDNGFIVGANKSGNILLIKTDHEGDTLWSREFGGVNSDIIHDIRTTSEGGIIFCGGTQNQSNGGFDVYVVKTDSNGLLTSIKPSVQKAVSFTVFPNPTSGFFSVNTNLDRFDYYLYNIIGEQILAGNVSPYAKTNFGIDMRGYPKGLYLLKVNCQSDIKTFKIIHH